MSKGYRLYFNIRWAGNGQHLATLEDFLGLVAQGRTVAETVEIAQDVARRLIESWSLIFYAYHLIFLRIMSAGKQVSHSYSKQRCINHSLEDTVSLMSRPCFQSSIEVSHAYK